MQQYIHVFLRGLFCRVATRRFLHVLGLTAAAVCAGCAGTYETLSPPLGADFNPEDQSLHGQTARNALDEAARMIHGGHYAQAILRLERIVDRYGHTEAGIEARYLLATAYDQIGGLEKAQGYYNEYLALAPSGPRARESAARLAYLSGVPIAEPAEDPTVVALREQMRANPDDMAPALELADYLWAGERYQEAGSVYINLAKRWPGLMADATLRQRLAIEANGSYTVLTPEEVVRRAREKHPLQIANVQSYRSGFGRGGTFGGVTDLRDRYYHVSGEAVNQGEKTLRSVQVRVTLYGFGRRIFDTRTVSVGQLAPGESHAFSVRFENFDNIENVWDFECVGTYVL